VIHEIAHATVWVDGDASLNENLASFVGDQGAADFFRARGGDADPALARARQAKADSRIFNAELLALRDELARVYEACGKRSQKLAYKKAAVAGFRTRFRDEVRGRLSGDTYDWILDERIPLNNALLMTFVRYHGDEDVFAKIHASCGGELAETVRLLTRLAEADDPRAAMEAYAEKVE
jgi:predicted aminopeptidase